ncbi:hypothetical protein ACRQOC_004554 [Klebsiella pneumoniae]
MNIETVNGLIASLENAGELSIREQKFLKLAKAFNQLAAENVALKAAAKKTLAHWAAAEPGKMELMMDKCVPALRDAYCETPATDRIVAGIKADGVEEWVSSRGGRWNGTTEEALKFAKQLREGKSEEVKS